MSGIGYNPNDSDIKTISIMKNKKNGVLDPNGQIILGIAKANQSVVYSNQDYRNFRKSEKTAK